MTTGWPDTARLGWWDAIWRRFWTLPVLIAVMSLVLGLLMLALDAQLEEAPAYVFQAGADGARSVLSTIAGAMISVTGLVFSITIVVLQLASSQFSPRILRSFLESRVVQVTLGIFTGSFVYALTVLRAVRGGENDMVPELAVTGAFIYVLVAVGMFLAFIDHITSAVQVSHVMSEVRRRTVATAHRLARESKTPTWSPRPGTPSVELHHDERCGYLTALDKQRLLEVVKGLDGVVELELTPGDHLVAEQVIGRVWGAEVSEGVRDELRAVIHVAGERDIAADAGFGVRQLLDIADRALSPGVNDPTTAVQAVNELHAVLRTMVQLPDPSPYLVVDDEVVALYRPQRYANVLDGVVSELLHHGEDSPRVLDRLREVVEDLLDVARLEHRAATEAAIDRMRTSLSGGRM